MVAIQVNKGYAYIKEEPFPNKRQEYGAHWEIHIKFDALYVTHSDATPTISWPDVIPPRVTVTYVVRSDDFCKLIELPEVQGSVHKELAPHEFVRIIDYLLSQGWVIPYRARVLKEYIEEEGRYPTLEEWHQLLACLALSGVSLIRVEAPCPRV
jgi:hypothetical protein